MSTPPTNGRTKQGAEYGRFKGIRTLHPLLATISTPASRPLIATVRMRRGKAADSRGAPNGPATRPARWPPGATSPSEPSARPE